MEMSDVEFEFKRAQCWNPAERTQRRKAHVLEPFVAIKLPSTPGTSQLPSEPFQLLFSVR